MSDEETDRETDLGARIWPARENEGVGRFWTCLTRRTGAAISIPAFNDSWLFEDQVRRRLLASVSFCTSSTCYDTIKLGYIMENESDIGSGNAKEM